MQTDRRDVPITPNVLASLRPPPPIVRALQHLTAAGYAARLTGECVLAGALGRWPAWFRAETSMPREVLLAREPRAVPTGVRSGRISIPTAAGPVDVLPSVHIPEPVCFRILELVWDAEADRACAPAECAEDLAARRLVPAKQPGDAAFSLEAARLIARYDLRPSAATFERARSIPFEIADAGRTHLRHLLRDVLLAPGCLAGLRWLRECGGEGDLVRGVRDEAASLVAAVPARLPLRLAAWLIDADARALLRTLRFGSEFAARVYRLLEWHPIDRHVDVGRDAAVRKWSKKTRPGEIEDCIALARAEARWLETCGKHSDAARIEKRLARLEEAIARVRRIDAERSARPELALGGAEVMAILGCEPGPQVGRAMAFLRARVAEDPANATPTALRELLEAWRTSQGDRG